MPHNRSELEVVAGKLISAIQREWGNELGEDFASESEVVMHASHELLLAARGKSISALLAGRSISEFLGEQWVSSHPRVLFEVSRLQALVERNTAV
jgi:hypothetical protein